MSCNSASNIIADLWKEYGEIAKNLGCTAAGIATANPASTIACLEKINKVEEAAKKAISFWNNMVNNSWATIGPRKLTLGEKEEGTLALAGDRLFITATPFSCDKIKISIKEKDGKGKVSINACLFSGSKDQSAFNLEWNDTSSERKEDDQNFTKEISGVKGKYLSVLFNCKSVTKTFNYTIKVSKVD